MEYDTSDSSEFSPQSVALLFSATVCGSPHLSGGQLWLESKQPHHPLRNGEDGEIFLFMG